MTTAYNKFFINGEWVEPDRPTLEVINPVSYTHLTLPTR